MAGNLWQESYDKPRQCVKKQRHHFGVGTMVPIFKAVVSPIVMYECESSTINMSEAKELMLWNCGAGEDS